MRIACFLKIPKYFFFFFNNDLVFIMEKAKGIKDKFSIFEVVYIFSVKIQFWSLKYIFGRKIFHFKKFNEWIHLNKFILFN